MLQETLLAAWRGLDEFQGRASLRTWLYRIATNRCLNLLRSSARRPAKEVPPMPEPPPPTRRSGPLWLQPYPDVLLEGVPDSALVRRRATRRAKRPRWRSSQGCNGCRRCSAPLLCCATSSASRPAKALRSWKPPRRRSRGAPTRTRSARRATDRPLACAAPGLAAGGEIVGRFVEAFERGDTKAVVALLADDAWLTMPPYVRVPGEGGHHPLPRASGGRARPSAPSRADPRQRPTRLRLLRR
jgi:hypothetical protein